jgi:hypothetical protein
MNTMAELISFIVYLLQLFVYIIIIQAILSWLVAFNVVNLNKPAPARRRWRSFWSARTRQARSMCATRSLPAPRPESPPSNTGATPA